MRTWIGHQLLAPSVYGDDYENTMYYPLCFTPDKQVSVRTVMDVLRNRFEGTIYSPDETGRTDMRVIGSDTSQSVHVQQVFPNLPAEMSAVMWECVGPAPYGVFVPISNACTKASDAYSRNQPADEQGVFAVNEYPYYTTKALTDLCVEKNEYKVYGYPVKAYWSKAENVMVKAMDEILAEAAAMEDSKKAAAHIEEYCTKAQEQAFADARQLLNDVTWYHGVNGNTLKNGKNPETNEIYDELKPIEPMKVILDASAYANASKET